MSHLVEISNDIESKEYENVQEHRTEENYENSQNGTSAETSNKIDTCNKVPVMSFSNDSLHSFSNSMTNDVRKGKWTKEEEMYANKIIEMFNAGILIIPECDGNLTLRMYLANKLRCDPMRVTKKYSGVTCLGRRAFRVQPPASSLHMCEALQKELNMLESKFLNKELIDRANLSILCNHRNDVNNGIGQINKISAPYPMGVYRLLSSNLLKSNSMVTTARPFVQIGDKIHAFHPFNSDLRMEYMKSLEKCGPYVSTVHDINIATVECDESINRSSCESNSEICITDDESSDVCMSSSCKPGLKRSYDSFDSDISRKSSRTSLSEHCPSQDKNFIDASAFPSPISSRPKFSSQTDDGRDAASSLLELFCSSR